MYHAAWWDACCFAAGTRPDGRRRPASLGGRVRWGAAVRCGAALSATSLAEGKGRGHRVRRAGRFPLDLAQPVADRLPPRAAVPGCLPTAGAGRRHTAPPPGHDDAQPPLPSASRPVPDRAAGRPRIAGAMLTRPPPVLEIAANSLASALAAEAGGATRIELCSALELGGITPSAGLLARVRERVSIPIHVLVRPRAGDFAYSAHEHETMLADIAHCAALGCDGVVIGALAADGQVDAARCRELLQAAGPLDTTFHRAIDVCPDMCGALEAIVALGFRRVLTSGGAADAVAGAGMVRRLVERAGDRIAVMPGSGINAGNIAALAAATGAGEFHASAKRALPSRMRGAAGGAPDMREGEVRSDVDEVRALRAQLRAGTAAA